MAKDFKDTLNMPQTEFEMRGNLTKKDPEFIKFWEEKDIINKTQGRDKTFILHDGPPYANGNIHVGHALNKIIKDIIVRERMIAGYSVDWRAGWDTHGLPIEVMIQKNGANLGEMGLEAYLKKARNYALTQVEKQQKQFRSLAITADFTNKYMTLLPKFEASEIKVFHKMLNEKLAYQDLKPINWSWSSQTALAEAEIEYKDVESYSIYVKFKLNEELSILIWTTTPWTLPANVALAFGERINYSVVEVDGEKLVIANDLIGTLSIETKKEFKVVESFDPSKIIGEKAINPINGAESLITFGHHVTTEAGTGIVHIAGGHGADDYIITKENNLPLVVVTDDRGIQQNSGKYDGQFYLKNEPIIIEDLTANGGLLHHSKFVHSHPVDWRTKKPIIYRATKQWFVSIDKVKDSLIKETENVKWKPVWGGKRLAKMTQDRDDWCISRQRVWGVPIPVIYDSNDQPIVNTELQSNIEAIFAEKGVYGYLTTNIKDLLPASITFEKGMRKETDTLDVWFDSGTAHQYLTPGVQSDIYVEGTDQFRGWFNSSFITGNIMNGMSPYKEILTHGFVTDGKGEKMSKSKGNVMDPLKITGSYGADILRLWAASSDFTDNLKISDEIIKQVASEYRKIRNTIKFILGNLHDFDDSQPELSKATAAVKSNLVTVWNVAKEAFVERNFNAGIKAIMNELTSGSISWLTEYAKETIYVYEADAVEKLEVQSILKFALEVILYVLAPVLPVTVEEAFQSLVADKDASIFLTTFEINESGSTEAWKEFNSIRNLINKEVEVIRESKKLKKIGEAHIELSLPQELTSWNDEKLKATLLVGKLDVVEGEFKATAKVFENSFKCERCWKMVDSINTDEVCTRCAHVLKTLEA